LQGTEIQIKELVKGKDFICFNAIDGHLLSSLLANEKPSIGNPTENTLEYYIDKTLECVTNVKSGIQTEGGTLLEIREESLEEVQGTSSCWEVKRDVSDHGQGIPQFSMVNENGKVIYLDTYILLHSTRTCTNSDPLFFNVTQKFLYFCVIASRAIFWWHT
jgi:hypothetical protein